MPTRTVTVGTTPTRLMPFNNRRTAASFTNNGAATIFVSNDESGIVAGGYPIAVDGALDLIRALGDEPHILWFAQVAAGTENMRILEAFGALPELTVPSNLPAGILEAE